MNRQNEKLKVKGEKYKICATDFEGITLVALVITIIVLIILAAVSINAVMNDGLIENAKTAKEDYELKASEENTILENLLQDIEDAKGTTATVITWSYTDATNTAVTDGTNTFNVGEEVDYNPAAKTYTLSGDLSGTGQNQTVSSTELTWYVLGVDAEGRLELIADNEMGDITLCGATGFNNRDNAFSNVITALYGSGNGTQGRYSADTDWTKMHNLDAEGFINCSFTNVHNGWSIDGGPYEGYKAIGIGGEMFESDNAFQPTADATCVLVSSDDGGTTLQDRSNPISCVPIIALGTDFDASSIKINN